MTDGITITATDHKIVLVVAKDGDSIQVPLTLDQSKTFRDQLQSVMSEFEPTGNE